MSCWRQLAVFLLAGILCLPLAAPAADKKSGFPPGALFRYKNHLGHTVITSNLPEEALYAGYEVLDSRGVVVRVVAPGIPKDERDEYYARQRRKEKDQQLLRMYLNPAGAERTRQRQVEAVQLKLAYSQNSLNRKRAKRDKQIARAASFERRGKEVPAAVSDLIQLYSQQVENELEEIEAYQQKIAGIDQKFSRIIERLEMLTGIELEQPKAETATSQPQTDKQ